MNNPLLKDRSYYADLYDRHTVEQCRRIEAHKEAKATGKDDKVAKKQKEAATQVAIKLLLYFKTGERYENRRATINEWMERDAHRDKLSADAQPPKNVLCRGCSGLMVEDWRYLRTILGNPDRVLCFFSCPNGCRKGRIFYGDGSEYIPEPHLCTKCQSEVTVSDSRKGETVITTYTCPSCGHKDKKTLDLTVTKEEPKEDPEFEKDKARFCLSEEEGYRFARWKVGLDALKELYKDEKEKESNKELYEAIEAISLLTINQVEELLLPLIEKAGYKNLRLDKPEVERDVSLPFSCLEGNASRKEYDSTHSLKKVIDTALSTTNWRLMSEGISYRLGYLTGRLRAYERKEDLKHLAEVQLKKNKPSKKKEHKGIDL